MHTSTSRLRRRIALGVALATAMSGTVMVAAPAQAVSPDVVLSEVYGGGGNAGALLKQDFIELYNTSASPVLLTGWSVQYTSATGSGWTNKTDLVGTIQPGAHWLVAQATGTGGTIDLPDAGPDRHDRHVRHRRQGRARRVDDLPHLRHEL